LEQRQVQPGYRRYFLGQDAFAVSAAALILILSNLVFFVTMDRHFVTTHRELHWLLLLRGGMIIGSVATIVICRLAIRESCSILRYDQAVLSWGMVSVVLLSLVVLTRPVEYVAQSTQFDLFVMLILMMVMPDRRYWRLVPSAQFMIQQIAILLSFSSFIPSAHFVSQLFVYGALFLLGAILSTMFFRQRRESYYLSQSLAKARQLAESAHQAKSDFIALASHEIRTPLQVSRSACDLLMLHSANDVGKVQRYMRIMDESLTALTELVDNVFELSRMDAGRLSIQKAPCDLRRLLDSMAELYGSQAIERQLSLSLQVEDSLPDWILTDPARFRQIVDNLVDNALKFTPIGTIRIEAASVHRPGDSRPALRIAVEDTGVGVAEENIHRLFDPFYQVDSALVRTGEGMGLGLSISQKLAEQLEGRITVGSSPGVGSCFALEIPCIEVAAPAPIVSTESLQPPTVQNTPGKALSILVVEDSRFSRIVLGDQLLQMGQAVEVADRGESALERIDERGFDLVLMDIRMPGMTGIELASAIREKERALERRPVPLVAITGEQSSELEAQAARVGIDRILYKPVTAKTLKGLLKRHGAEIASSPKRIRSLELNARMLNDFDGRPSRAEQYRQLLLADLTGALRQLRDEIHLTSGISSDSPMIGERVHFLKSLVSQLDSGEFTSLWQEWLRSRERSSGSKDLAHLDALLALCEEQGIIEHAKGVSCE